MSALLDIAIRTEQTKRKQVVITGQNTSFACLPGIVTTFHFRGFTRFLPSIIPPPAVRQRGAPLSQCGRLELQMQCVQRLYMVTGLQLHSGCSVRVFAVRKLAIGGCGEGRKWTFLLAE